MPCPRYPLFSSVISGFLAPSRQTKNGIDVYIHVKQFSQVRRLVKLGITKRDPAEVGTYGHIWLSHFANISFMLFCMSSQFTPEEQSRFARLDIDPGEPNAPPPCFSAIFHQFSAVFRRFPPCCFGAEQKEQSSCRNELKTAKTRR